MIYINENLRIKRLDRCSLALEEFRSPAAENSRTRDKKPKWFVCGYYGDLKSALFGALNKQLFDCVENEIELCSVVEIIDKARKDIVKSLEKINSEKEI